MLPFTFFGTPSQDVDKWIEMVEAYNNPDSSLVIFALDKLGLNVQAVLRRVDSQLTNVYGHFTWNWMLLKLSLKELDGHAKAKHHRHTKIEQLFWSEVYTHISSWYSNVRDILSEYSPILRLGAPAFAMVWFAWPIIQAYFATMARGELVSIIITIFWLLEKGIFWLKVLQAKYQRVELLLSRVPGAYNGPKLPEGAWDPVTTETRDVVAKLVEVLHSGSLL